MQLTLTNLWSKVAKFDILPKQVTPYVYGRRERWSGPKMLPTMLITLVEAFYELNTLWSSYFVSTPCLLVPHVCMTMNKSLCTLILSYIPISFPSKGNTSRILENFCRFVS